MRVWRFGGAILVAAGLAGVGMGAGAGVGDGTGDGRAGSVQRLATASTEVERALTALGLQDGVGRDDFRVDRATLELEMTYSGRFRLHGYVMQEPYRAPGMLEVLARDLGEMDGVAPRIARLSQLARPEGAPPPRGGLTPELRDQILGAAKPIQAAITQVYDGTKRRFQGQELETATRNEAAMPADLARETASLVLASLDATLARDALVKESDFRSGGAFDHKSRRTAEQLREFLARWWEDPGGKSAFMAVEPALESLDLNGLYAKGVILASEVDRAAERCLSPGFGEGSLAEFQYVWDTPRGRFAVGGRGANVYEGEYAMVLDLGGNDRYRGPGAVSGRAPVSIVLDLAGDDRYEAADSALAGPGGAILGYALVVDRGRGADEYRGPTWSAGFGFLGVGAVFDDGGDDVYTSQWLSQGTGIFGMGLLIDADGSDTYGFAREYEEFPVGRGQGFGGPTGIGALIDGSGGDRYRGFPGDGCEGVGGEFMQGASRGVQEFRAGGLGMLFDLGEGNDTYRACGRSQGAASGCGLGGLVDFGGNDAYDSGDESQGCGAAMGAGILVDLAGDDVYAGDSGRVFALGAGHDLGLGMLIEVSGKDTYRGGEMVLGESSDQGAGWFLELRGEDVYEPASERSMACVDARNPSLFRTGVPGVVVFVDLEQPEGRLPGFFTERRRGGSGVFAPSGAGSSLGGGFVPGVAGDAGAAPEDDGDAEGAGGTGPP